MLFPAAHSVLLLQEGILVRHHSHWCGLLNLLHALLSRSLLGAALLLPIPISLLLFCTSPILSPVITSSVMLVSAVALTAALVPAIVASIIPSLVATIPVPSTSSVMLVSAV